MIWLLSHTKKQQESRAQDLAPVTVTGGEALRVPGSSFPGLRVYEMWTDCDLEARQRTEAQAKERTCVVRTSGSICPI